MFLQRTNISHFHSSYLLKLSLFSLTQLKLTFSPENQIVIVYLFPFLAPPPFHPPIHSLWSVHHVSIQTRSPSQYARSTLMALSALHNYLTAFSYYWWAGQGGGGQSAMWLHSSVRQCLCSLYKMYGATGMHCTLSLYYNHCQIFDESAASQRHKRKQKNITDKVKNGIAKQINNNTKWIVNLFPPWRAQNQFIKCTWCTKFPI